MELWCHRMKYHLVPWNSMELWDCHFMTCYPGLPMDIPVNTMELWSRQKKSPSSIGFHGIRRAPFQMTQLFHGIFHGIPCNSGAAKWNITKFHGIPWNIPWNSMEFWCRQMKYYLVPWNSMEFWDCHVIQCHATLDFHGIFHGIPWKSGVTK